MEYAQSVDLNRIVTAIRSVWPEQSKPIPLHAPTFEGNEWGYVKDCIDTGWVSSVGKYVDQFERKLEQYTGVRYAVAVVNGTAALHMALLLAGVRKDDEILLPALTFVATANVVAYCNAVPHFVDSEIRTLGMDGNKLEGYLKDIAEIRKGECYNKKTNRRISAIVPMHTFGHPVDLATLMNVCERFHLILIEDAAESIGSFYQGRHTGNFGEIAAMSFNGNKTITTGGGGAILTNDELLGKRAKYLTTQAKVPHQWKFYHDEIGYNYRMPNLNAALGCAQLERLPEFVERKRALAKRYEEVLQMLDGLRLFTEPQESRSNYWLNAVLLDEANASYRDALLERLQCSGVMARPAWELMYHLPMFTNCPKMKCCVAEDIVRRLINIPSSADLG